MTKCYVKTSSAEETKALGKSIGNGLPKGTIVLLSGDLGCGKTTLTRGIANALGIPEDEVTSPSFNIIHEYDSFVHIDFYRLSSEDALEDLGLDEILLDDRIKVIEWFEVGANYLENLNVPIVKINCLFCDENERTFEIIDPSGILCEKIKKGGFNVKDS
ncbi:MAG: tRNA (adenosine(37)-N6)-threonylcarbamoyltransferase complex ATPase subunit type 1 TsaE [Desulfurobacteriaceae bacterium]